MVTSLPCRPGRSRRCPSWFNVVGLVSVPAVLIVACMVAPPDAGWLFGSPACRALVAAVAEATPITAMTMSTETLALEAIRRKSKNDKHYPFSFHAYGVSCRARAERV